MFADLVALHRTHSLLIQEFNCVESAQDPHAVDAAADDDDERDGDDPQPAAPLPLPTLNTLASLHASEDEDTKLPEQRRITAQIMRNWAPHMVIEAVPPNARTAKKLSLHKAQKFNAVTRTDEGDMGHSILQKDILTVCVALVLPSH